MDLLDYLSNSKFGPFELDVNQMHHQDDDNYEDNWNIIKNNYSVYNGVSESNTSELNMIKWTMKMYENQNLNRIKGGFSSWFSY